MPDYAIQASFNPGTLGKNLAEFSDRVEDYINAAKREACAQGEVDMHAEAPWTQTGAPNRWGRISTGRARNSLWMKPYGTAQRGGIRAGHEAPYGIYLEEGFGLRYRIVYPVLMRAGDAFMRSMNSMFTEMDSHAPPPVEVLPGTETRPSIDNVKVQLRDIRGRFVSTDPVGAAKRKTEKAARAAARTATTAKTAVTKRTRRKK